MRASVTRYEENASRMSRDTWFCAETEESIASASIAVHCLKRIDIFGVTTCVGFRPKHGMHSSSNK